MSDQLLKIDQVAARLAISRSSVYRLLKVGDILAVHVGAAVRIPESAVDRYIDNCARAARRQKALDQ